MRHEEMDPGRQSLYEDEFSEANIIQIEPADTVTAISIEFLTSCMYAGGTSCSSGEDQESEPGTGWVEFVGRWTYHLREVGCGWMMSDV